MWVEWDDIYPAPRPTKATVLGLSIIREGMEASLYDQYEPEHEVLPASERDDEDGDPEPFQGFEDEPYTRDEDGYWGGVA